MTFRVVRSIRFEHDLDLVHDHLIACYVNLGDTFSDAFDRAEARIAAIETDMEDLARAPHQGTVLDHIAPGLRSVTKNRAIFYFDVDDERELVRVLAVFFGGQEHRRHMLRRMSRAG